MKRQVAGRETAIDTRRSLLNQVEEAVTRLLQAVREVDNPERLRVGDWSVKDTLGHIAFWHESFARNVRALGEGTQPKVLVGRLSELNQISVESSRTMSADQIQRRITRAQGVIRRLILSLPADTLIPYRKGSRDYTPDEHLSVVRDHIAAHVREIEKAARGAGRPARQ